MINPNVYYTVQGWMISELGLKGNDLAAYAIIYGFSQDGASEYSGSARYLCEWLGCSRSTIMAVLKKLTENGLLVKRDIYKNGVMFCTYTAAPRGCPIPGQGVQKLDRGCPIPGQGGVQSPDRGCPIPGHNNTRDNTRDINKEINIGDAGASPAPPEKGKKAKAKKETPAKIVHGHFQHVLLTEDEHAKLVNTYGQETAAAAIRFLDEYMEDKPKYKSASHYLAIRRWVIDALNEKARKSGPARPAARGGYPGAMVGPNGIPIDPTKNDLDGQF